MTSRYKQFTTQLHVKLFTLRFLGDMGDFEFLDLIVETPDFKCVDWSDPSENLHSPVDSPAPCSISTVDRSIGVKQVSNGLKVTKPTTVVTPTSGFSSGLSYNEANQEWLEELLVSEPKFHPMVRDVKEAKTIVDKVAAINLHCDTIAAWEDAQVSEWLKCVKKYGETPAVPEALHFTDRITSVSRSYRDITKGGGCAPFNPPRQVLKMARFGP